MRTEVSKFQSNSLVASERAMATLNEVPARDMQTALSSNTVGQLGKGCIFYSRLIYQHLIV